MDGVIRGTVVVVSLILASWATGCSSLGPCDRSDDSNPPDLYDGGTVEDGSYMSSPWTGPFLSFAGGQRYELRHGLGCLPRFLACWASFSSTGISSGSIAPPAGNMCVVQEITDERIVIKNDTCSDMYVLVTAWSPPCTGGE